MSIHEQAARLRLRWPGCECRFVRRRRSKVVTFLVSRGRVRPTISSLDYFVRIEYDGRLAPKVWVDEPQLVPRDGEDKIPHMYNQERVCAFMPPVDWSAAMYIADYVVPRISQWLLFYELWHTTGEWYGGGIQPGVPERLKPLITRVEEAPPLE